MTEADPGLPTQAIWDIPFENLEFHERIGKGSFGSVFKGSYLGLDVAIKKIEKADDPEYLKYIDREVSMLQSLRHPFIVNFSGICVHSTGLYIVTEFVSGGDVRQLLKQTPPIGWEKRVSIAVDLAKAMVFLHAKKIIHRDLKSKNILLDEFQRIRLCDFGFARMSEQTKKSRHMTMCGTEGWVAPEILLGMSYDTSCDVFSYGVVLAELITGRKPGVDLWVRSPETCFDINPEELKTKAIAGCPQELISICIECCLYEPLTRPKFEEVVNQLKVVQAQVKAANTASAASLQSSPFIQTPISSMTPIISPAAISPDITTSIQQINLNSSTNVLTTSNNNNNAAQNVATPVTTTTTTTNQQQPNNNIATPSSPPPQHVALAHSRRNTMSLHRKSTEFQQPPSLSSSDGGSAAAGANGTYNPSKDSIRVSGNKNNTTTTKPSDSIWKIAAKPKNMGYQTLKRKQYNTDKQTVLLDHIAKMIERATSDYYYDTSYIQDFLLTYRCFVQPQQVFELLLTRYIANSPDNFSSDLNNWKKVQRVIQLRVIIFFKRWIDYYPQDFLEENMEENLSEFDKISAQQNASTALLMNNTISTNESLQDPKLITELQKKRTELHESLNNSSDGAYSINTENILNTIQGSKIKLNLSGNSINNNNNSNNNSDEQNGNNCNYQYPVSIIPPPTISEYLEVTDIHPLELARQITIINSIHFNRIKGREFLEYIWEKCRDEQSPYVGSSFVDIIPAENIHSFVKKCNDLSRYVSTEVLKNTQLQKRVATIERFIETADKLLSHYDYAGVFSIIEPLCDSSIERLSETWKNVSPKILSLFEQLKSLCSKENDHKKYREALLDTKPPSIPNIQLLLDELSFIETSSPRLLPGGIVNFFHYRQISRKILQSQQLQKHIFRSLPSIQKALSKPPGELFDNELIKNYSLKCEPPTF
ncbi:hypothetical protein DICPUDRAFT_152685 [Dictyostelium purpureum]|uniref:non-specific serine/threonine protein kinase n=1 Tax=Dictyostelium purpureum TaxID=5786 RepID=F0ZM13_DICPU|nr:uncharacterized protein DICPUDRAFT_152685 [Dictyostelium purpureum]EGC35032.1 hypothetical protein DICPUDRAFT_152685 [Dictyostelium purpureum]|eukprot:XP_003288460.1 hypothetical protein DICPUDRAFT_152685 [Dictyostelium purpureum]